MPTPLLIAAEAYLRFIADIRKSKARWYCGPPSGVLYCDEQAEAESWHEQEVERSVVVTGQGREAQGDQR